jgi:hypothetical protein
LADRPNGAAIISAMEDALLTVAVAVTVVCAVIAVFTLAATGKTYRQIGSGGMDTGEPDAGAQRSAPEGTPIDARDEEIRQLLQARNARRERRGAAPLDVDAELAALSGQAVDTQLCDEVRQLVLARNSRRERRGEAPLDVEAEIERHLRELN